jgi:hypothetical protein
VTAFEVMLAKSRRFSSSSAPSATARFRRFCLDRLLTTHVFDNAGRESDVLPM